MAWLNFRPASIDTNLCCHNASLNLNSKCLSRSCEMFWYFARCYCLCLMTVMLWMQFLGFHWSFHKYFWKLTASEIPLKLNVKIDFPVFFRSFHKYSSILTASEVPLNRRFKDFLHLLLADNGTYVFFTWYWCCFDFVSFDYYWKYIKHHWISPWNPGTR